MCLYICQTTQTRWDVSVHLQKFKAEKPLHLILPPEHHLPSWMTARLSEISRVLLQKLRFSPCLVLWSDFGGPQRERWVVRGCELRNRSACLCPLPQHVPLSLVMGTATHTAGAWCINPDGPPVERQAWRTLGKERSATGVWHRQGVDLCLCAQLWLKRRWKKIEFMFVLWVFAGI